MIDKDHLKTTMLALTEANMKQAKSNYADFLSAARLDRSEPIESDEQAQAENAADLAEAFDDNVHDYAAKIAALKAVDFGPRTDVSVGAVVGLGARNLVIGVSTAEFQCAGKTYMGISPAAPIFSAMEGKTAGEVCEFNGRTLTIGDVY
jgi:transcription elongation GreA/GreB family factor